MKTSEFAKTMSASEADTLRASVDGILARLWTKDIRDSDDVAFTRLGELWEVAAEQGWLELSSEAALDALVVVLDSLGRVACPLALADAFVAGDILGDQSTFRAQVESGSARVSVSFTGEPNDVVRYIEGAPALTHILQVVETTGVALLRPIVSVRPTPGLARPSWSEVALGEVEAQVPIDDSTREAAKALIRLGLVARAIGAARRAVEYSIVHANERKAFGKPIGAFQAVSHRVVDGMIDVSASRQLIDEAVKAWTSGRRTWLVSAEAAVEYGGPAAIRAQFGAHHTLAAVGYFEEHDLPWLFRRVNADVSSLDGLHMAGGELADLLIAGDGLPSLELGDRAEEFRAEFKEFLQPFITGAAIVHHDSPPNEALVSAAREAGYITLSWPTEFGGLGASVEEQVVASEELAYNRVRLVAKGQADVLGTAIIRTASEAQQQRVLPLLANGELRSYLGYSEPEVGSDLVQMRTRAVRDGDEWVVNGQKMWGTNAHVAEWVWLAARTDPDAERPHAGITVFLTKIDRPGIELARHRALSGETSCTTFFDDFRIPDADRIGEVNGGWKVITGALAQERVFMANIAATILRLLDDVLDEVRKNPETTVGPRGSAQRRLISELAARLQAARVLVNASVRANATGGGARLEAPMAKIIASKLHEDFSEAALRIFGPSAALGDGLADVPGRGAFDYNLRFSIMQVVGGGTIDIQHNLVARSLGLPR